MIKEVNDYFTARIKEIDSAFRVHEDPFNIDNIGASKFDRAFHILPGDMACSPSVGNHTTDRLPVEVCLFFKGYRDPSQYLISAYDAANEFRLNCMKPKYATELLNIKNITCTSLRPEPLTGNDNAIRMRCQFDVTLSYGTDT